MWRRRPDLRHNINSREIRILSPPHKANVFDEGSGTFSGTVLLNLAEPKLVLRVTELRQQTSRVPCSKGGRIPCEGQAQEHPSRLRTFGFRIMMDLLPRLSDRRRVKSAFAVRSPAARPQQDGRALMDALSSGRTIEVDVHRRLPCQVC